jgi:hypothetical protein
MSEAELTKPASANFAARTSVESPTSTTKPFERSREEWDHRDHPARAAAPPAERTTRVIRVVMTT